MEHYEINDKVEYYVKRGKLHYHRVGYIKDYRKGLFGARYLVCVADKVRELDFVKPKQILGLAPRKEYKLTK